ncbi:MAG: hypothetical protein JOY76_08925 [Hyphomicrobiales bacterium]|nr:hypothetical protein [Hyphomicrobiales bacterium]
MSKAELQEFLEAVEKVRLALASTPEKALAFLQGEGMLTIRGELATPYAPVAAKDPEDPDTVAVVA